MDVASIDHVNLRIPADGVDAAVEFYGERLGFPIEGLKEHRRDEQSFFDIRLAPAHVLHLWPTDEFVPPSGDNFNHVALLVDAGIGTIREHLDGAGIGIVNELDAPLGATGKAPAVYVEDPFGYQVELKAAAD